MMPNSLKAVAAVGLVVGLAFYVGRLSRPGDDETPKALLALRDSVAAFEAQRVADSIALARTRLDEAAARAAEARARRQATAAAARSAAYADTLRVLNDSLVAVTTPAGVVDTETVSPAVTARFRADSQTIASQATALEAADAARIAADARSAAADRALASANAELGALRRQIPLERASEYARGKRDGTRKGIVLGSLGTMTIVFTGVKVVQATRLQQFSP